MYQVNPVSHQNLRMPQNEPMSGMVNFFADAEASIARRSSQVHFELL